MTTKRDNKCFNANLDSLGITDMETRVELKLSYPPEELFKILEDLTKEDVLLMESRIPTMFGYVKPLSGSYMMILDEDSGMNLLTLTHELAHIHRGIGKGHDKEFMNEWRRLCDECVK